MPAAGSASRLLTGSYNGQTIQIWAALFIAAVLAAVLVDRRRRRANGWPTGAWGAPA